VKSTTERGSTLTIPRAGWKTGEWKLSRGCQALGGGSVEANRDYEKFVEDRQRERAKIIKRLGRTLEKRFMKKNREPGGRLRSGTYKIRLKHGGGRGRNSSVEACIRKGKERDRPRVKRSGGGGLDLDRETATRRRYKSVSRESVDKKYTGRDIKKKERNERRRKGNPDGTRDSDSSLAAESPGGGDRKEEGGQKECIS